MAVVTYPPPPSLPVAPNICLETPSFICFESSVECECASTEHGHLIGIEFKIENTFTEFSRRQSTSKSLRSVKCKRANGNAFLQFIGTVNFDGHLPAQQYLVSARSLFAGL